MNRTTGAQRHNKRQDAIWEKVKAIEASKGEEKDKAVASVQRWETFFSGAPIFCELNQNK